MKKSGKRILSFILTAVMVFALLPVFGKPMVVKAEDTPAEHVMHAEQCSDQETDCKCHKGWKAISTWKDLKSLGEDGGSGYLSNNIKISEPFDIDSGKTVNLCLNGYSITQTADCNTIVVVGKLNLYDEKDNSGKITHADGKNGSGVTNLGIFTMNGGTIEKNNGTDGGGVYNNQTFTMNGGIITENKTDLSGGGVYNNQTFTMNGGTIAGNTAYYNGGGVYNNGNFTMEGGTIEGNNATDLGGGVYNNRIFTMNGGYIADSVEGYITLYTVTFNSNDGTGKVIKQSVPENEDRNLTPNEFKFYGKVFTGWNTDSKGKGKSYTDKATININSDLTLNAQWIEEDKEGCDVIFIVNNGSWDDGTKEKTVRLWRYKGEDKALIFSDSDIPSLGKPDTGYKAGSWDTDPYTFNKNYVCVIDKEYPFTYSFKPIEYTIHYDSNGGVGTMEDQDRAYDDKAPLTTNTFTFEGKTFNGWNTAADGSGTHFKDGEVNNLSSTEGDTVTLYAQWTTNTYTVSWKDYDGTVLETDTDVAYGSTPSYDGETPIKEKEGNKEYTFSGWTPAIDIVKGAATYTATYSENEIIYTVTFDANGGKADTTTGTTNAEFKLSSLPTPTYEGYTFKGWFTEATGGSEISADTVYTQDTTIYAQWEKVEEPTEPEVPVITEPEPEPEIPEKDWLDDLRLALNIANELGGPQTVTYSGDFALPYEIMQYLVEHTDITFIYTVTYEGQEYTITIPAGKAIADPNIGWYGPLWLLANYGGENVPDIIAGSGRYTVVEGDTLSGIAAKFNTTVEELAKKNGIKNPDYIIVGQVIVY